MNDDLDRLELPEPVAWMCGPQCSTRHSLVRDAFMEIGAEIAPLYTETQVRTAILADRQRRHVTSANTSAGCVKESAESEHEAAEPERYQCRKCGYVGGEVIHPDCGYWAMPWSEPTGPQAAEPVAVHQVRYLKRPAGECEAWHDIPQVKRAELMECAHRLMEIESAPFYEFRTLYTRAAPAEVTEEMVERAAIAVFLRSNELNGLTGTWGDEEDVYKEAWRSSCRRALEAALGGGDA